MGSLILLALAGIVAAIVIPTYMAHKERAAIQTTVKKQPAKTKAVVPQKPLPKKPAPKKEPPDLAARERVISELHTLLSLQYAFYTENGRYAADPVELGFVASPDIGLTIIQADVNCFQAEGIHSRMQAPCESTAADCNNVWNSQQGERNGHRLGIFKKRLKVLPESSKGI